MAEAIDLARPINAELTVLAVAPEPSDPMLGYVAPANLEELNEQIKRGYQRLLDDALSTLPDDVPVTSVLSADSRDQ